MRLLFIWAIVLSIAYVTLSIVRHNHFESGGFDLGIYDQAVWQYSTFTSPYNTIKERFILGDHLTLTLPLLAPLYWIWPDVRMLLVFQAVFLSISTIAVYKLVLLRKFPGLVALVLGILYSLFYGIQYAVYFDFHPSIIAAGLLPWAVYFLESKKMKRFWLVVTLILLTQENMGIALISIGCIYWFRTSYRRISIAMIICGTLWSLVAAKIISLFSPIGFQYWPQISLHPVEIVSQFFNSEEKRQVWKYTLTSFSFLPLLSFGSMVAIVMDLAQYFITGEALARMWGPFTHHRILLGFFATLGTLEALEQFRRRKWPVEKIAVGLLVVGLFLQYVYHLPLNKLAKREFWRKEQWMNDNRELVSLVPGNASIAATQHLVPHLAHRKEIYIIYPKLKEYEDNRCGKRSCWWLDFAGKPEYLVVDTHPEAWITQLLETPDHVKEAVDTMVGTGLLKLNNKVGDAALYRIQYR